jgi:UDP-N-acetyl-D-glucosamine dehydrogenase
LGYVGLPLACTFARKGFGVLGFDIDEAKIGQLNAGKSYVGHVPADELRILRDVGCLDATSDFSRLRSVDAIILCVPTPLTRQREPDLSYVIDTSESVMRHLRRDQLVILESTTYPGTTSEIVRPILERGGLRSGHDFFLAYSPEREDPGNAAFTTADIPKVVGGHGPHALRLACALYDQIVPRTIPVSSLETAEAVKLTENIFRSVNVALVNELKIVYEAMGIDVWEVIEAAKTKPFGFMPFYPGPGLGGHCIPIDPFYLTWKAREFGVATRFIELAGEINTSMPHRVAARTIEALNAQAAKAPKGARILMLGVAYKKNVGDTRESPSFRIMELLERQGAEVVFHDPLVAEIGASREHPQFTGRRSVELTEDLFTTIDATVISTDHDAVDYGEVARWSRLVIDTRNVCARYGLTGSHIVKA